MDGPRPRRATWESARSPDAAWSPGRRRGRPPAGSSEQHLRAFEVEPEAHFLEARFRHRLPQPPMILGIKEQKPAAPRADQLAADGAILPSQLVPLVDVRVAHAP